MAITHCAAAVPGLCAESRSGRDRSRQVLLSRCAQQSTCWCCPASAGHAALTLSRSRAPCLQRHGTSVTAPGKRLHGPLQMRRDSAWTRLVPPNIVALR
ncbi:hypothetical protein EBA05_13530 [Xanthomonas oryzae pv. oryzae]|nr:hypothetical protein C0L90_13485 [Xanthomonas oryzae pv. oryzae]QBN24662.1 hypothetical protein EBA00_09100 [Xanthomonas oryzae pv. oryzae]QBN36082.1 hypothetical protein EBA03_13165 [Xanthomonas oryzae pv. oryzae]QBN39744.1 hypothetical protein EBA04_13705 [Xanthomonas oryzae pv. oryzae]QBN43386.1 hypothetical protein EBA05_13530 [Xanthomonas oryzae pv. oryzae]